MATQVTCDVCGIVIEKRPRTSHHEQLKFVLNKQHVTAILALTNIHLLDETARTWNQHLTPADLCDACVNLAWRLARKEGETAK